MSDFQQHPVSQVVWPWTGTAATKQEAPPSKIMAFVGFIIASSIAALFYFKTDHHVATYVIMTIASIILVCALFIPPAYKQIHHGLQIFAGFVGKALSWILLVPFFYLVFPFGRLCQKLTGKDPMNRKFPTDLTTYCDDRPEVTDKAYYTRQG